MSRVFGLPFGHLPSAIHSHPTNISALQSLLDIPLPVQPSLLRLVIHWSKPHSATNNLIQFPIMKCPTSDPVFVSMAESTLIFFLMAGQVFVQNVKMGQTTGFYTFPFNCIGICLSQRTGVSSLLLNHTAFLRCLTSLGRTASSTAIDLRYLNSFTLF